MPRRATRRISTIRPSHDRPGLPLRFDGRLYFANAAFFAQQVLDAVAANPNAKVLLISGANIDRIAASGAQVLRHLLGRLRDAGIAVVFSGLKKEVRDGIRGTGLDASIGAANVPSSDEHAPAESDRRLGRDGGGELLPAASAGVEPQR